MDGKCENGKERRSKGIKKKRKIEGNKERKHIIKEGRKEERKKERKKRKKERRKERKCVLYN